MSVIAFFSAKGSPGTTTAAMLTASLWPGRALLVDCDPVGGDIGLRLSDPDGHPLNLNRGMLTLLPVARRTMQPQMLLDHTQRVLGGTEVIVGLSGPEQGYAGGALWSALADAFRGLDGYDVIVDLGRIDSRSPLMPIMQQAHIAVCVTGTSVSNVFSARSRLHSLAPAVVGAGGVAPMLGVAVQAPANSRDITGAVATIQQEIPGAMFVGHLATDRTGAGIFDGRPVSRPERTLLVRSARVMVENLVGFIAPAPSVTEPVSEPAAPAFVYPPAPNGKEPRRGRRARDKEAQAQ